MAAVKCDLNTLLANGKCFQCFGELENQAIVVYFLNQLLAKKQGVTAPTPNSLRQTAECIACSRPETVADNLDSAVAQAGAVAAGVTGAATQTIAQIRAGATPFKNMTLTELRAIEIYLRCNLNAFL